MNRRNVPESDVPELIRESLLEQDDATGAATSREAETTQAGTDSQEMLRVGSEALGHLLEPSAPLRGSAQRLLQRVEALPLRYAPFWDRLTQMFELSESELMSELQRAGEPAKWPASGLPGVRVFEVKAGERLASAQTLLVRFGAGVRFPNHRHRSPERTLILEGGYVDEAGKEYLPGDFDDRGTENVHSFRAFPDEACIAASVHYGFDFALWPLRMFQRLLGH